MSFYDRIDAGVKLASALKKYQKQPKTVVIGLPRGGVVLAYEVAKALELPMDVIFPRKVGAPGNPELAIGAVTETGEGVFNEDLIQLLGVPQSYVQKEVEKEKNVAQHRLEAYRKVRPKIPLKGQTVILVDDGLATGATMKASIQSVRAEGANNVVVAVPVSPIETKEEIKEMTQSIIVLETPSYFQAIGQFYDEFGPTEDGEVIELLKKSLEN